MLLAQAAPAPGARRDAGRTASVGHFESHSPGIGERVPDLEAYDAGGREVRLRSLIEGHTTVLVLGCLT